MRVLPTSFLALVVAPLLALTAVVVPGVPADAAPAGRVTGRVIAYDEPYAGATVVAQQVTAEGSGERVMTYTSNDGTFVLPVAEEGTYDVRVEVPLHADTTLDGVEVGPGDTDLGDVVMLRSPLVSGYVLDADGQRHPGATVELWRLEDGAWSLAASASSGHGTAAAPRGWFLLEAPEPGRYAVKVTDPTGAHLDRWHPGVADRADAEILELGWGDTVNPDLALGSRGALTNSVPFTIGGGTEIGETMMVTSAPEWTVEPDSVSYMWLRNGEDTLDGYNHTIGANDVLTEMSVLVVARKAGWETYRVESDPVLVPGLAPLDGWKVKGKPRVGRTLRLVEGAWAAQPRTVRYGWLRNGKRIRGATEATYLLTRKDAGRRISVRVRAWRPDYPKAKFKVHKTRAVR